MDHVVHKYSNGVQAANYHQRALFQNTGTHTSSELHPNEECIDRHVLQQGSDREMIQSAFYSKCSSVYENLSPLESQRLEKDELIPNFDSYLSHVVEKTIQDITLESEIEGVSPEMNKGMLLQESMSEGYSRHLSEVGSQEICLEKGPQLDCRHLKFEVMPSGMPLNVQLNDADACMVISEGHSITREATKKDADTSCEFEANDILNMAKELQSFSQKRNGTSTRSLEQKEEINLSASNISIFGHELLCVEEPGLKDHPQEQLLLSESSRHESSNTYLSTFSCADGVKDTYKLQVPQKDFAREKPEFHSPDHDKSFLAKTDRKKEHSQQKTTKSHNFPLSPVSQANISPALKLLRKLTNDSHIIAYDAYNPSNESIQQATLQSCSPSVTLSQEAIESRRDTKEVEDINKRGFSISNTSRSTTHSEIKCKETSIFKRKLRSGKVVSAEIQPVDAFRGHETSIFKRELRSGKVVSAEIRPVDTFRGHVSVNKENSIFKKELRSGKVVSAEIQPMDTFRGHVSANKKKSKRRKKVNSSTPNHWILEKNECAICINSKSRIKKPLNCEDWQCLRGAGTSWKNGVRRSSRIRSRPLEFWRGERFLYGRVLKCLSTVIGIKYTSPESASTIKDETKRFKVQSYVDEKYSDAVNFAALY